MGSLKCSICLEKYKGRRIKPNHNHHVPFRTSRKSGSKAAKDTPTDLLEEQMSVIYLVHSILDVPLEECVNYLERYGNPADWVTLCHTCCTRLKKARDLSQHVLELQRKLEVIRRTMRNQVRVKDETGDHHCHDEDDDDMDKGGTLLTAAYEIRQYVSYASSEESKPTEDEEREPLIHIPPILVDESGDIVCKEEVEYEFDFEDAESTLSTTEFGVGLELPAVSNAEGRKEMDATEEVNGQNSEDDIHPRKSNRRLKNCKPASKTAMKDDNRKDKLLQNTVGLIPTPSKSKNSPTSSTPKTIKAEKTFNLKHRPPVVRKTSKPGTRVKPKRRRVGTTGKLQRRRKAVNAKSQLEKRLATLSKSNEESFHCKECTEVFPSRGKLASHVGRKHSIAEGFKCATCNKSIASISSLENHIRSAHHPRSICICSGCNIRSAGAQEFNNHLKNNEKCREKAVMCQICKTRYFATQEWLNIHVEVKHTNRPLNEYACPFCNKRHSCKVRLNEHLTAHHYKQPSFICEKCGKCFAIKDNLRNHFQTVHLNKEADGQKFPCKTCGRVFTNPSHLRRHEKLHGDDAPFLCTVCGKRYKVRSQLTTHMWSHDPDRYEKYSLYKYKNQPKKGRKKSQMMTDAVASNEQVTDVVESVVDNQIQIPSGVDMSNSSEKEVHEPIDANNTYFYGGYEEVI